MTYRRVIPRDLFNDGNLLKCYGQLYLELEKLGKEDYLFHNAQESDFMVIQDPNEGCTTLANVFLLVNDKAINLIRPLNSRWPYPLYVRDFTFGDDVPVFNFDGTLTDQFKSWLGFRELQQEVNNG